MKQNLCKNFTVFLTGPNGSIKVTGVNYSTSKAGTAIGVTAIPEKTTMFNIKLLVICRCIYQTKINSTLWYRTWIRRHRKEAGVDVQTCLFQNIVQCDRFPVYIKHVLLVRVGHFQTVHAWVEVQQWRRGVWWPNKTRINIGWAFDGWNKNSLLSRKPQHFDIGVWV